ncbi:ABC transporter permease [Saccharibacillus alkalitolerans]|uniref:ABC transporter permease subunit n=1 Tax=Saccharibacillus alkalitolerans TaxID=2705290 RepID=A0ABX0F2T7_9BACL|nr:ABC transporter permease subunit [Saccharibacillus alkalitolerans]NGZ74897.1 ABC transporter permease subunit [Saccharibacillus alkalitolerans]
MIGLIANESMKIYSRRLTWILLLLLLGITIGASVLGNVNSARAADWRTETEQLVRQYEDRLRIAELSPTLRADAENKLKIANYRLANDVPAPDPDPWTALLSFSGLIETVIVFAIIVGADIVAGEYTAGTMKLLLIRPHSRAAILFSKYIAVLLFAAAMLALLLLCGYAANVLFYGWGDLRATDLFLNGQGQVVQSTVSMQVLKMYGLSLFPIAAYVTFAFAVSTILRSGALAIGISLLIMIVGNSMIEATAKIEGLKYLPFANSDMSLYIFHLPARPEMTLNFSIAVLSAYIAALLLLSWIVFQQRDVSF